ncbi:MAG: hypothetical protein GKS03_08770 [Alphaproteobacteria bacterium]|nr:hypothetical protein [Alphaproteobacteria bacterium]
MPFPLAAALPIVGKVIDRILPDKAAKDAAKLALLGGQQQKQNQAVLDVPFDLAEWRANTLASTPSPTLTNSKSKSSSVSFKVGG